MTDKLSEDQSLAYHQVMDWRNAYQRKSQDIKIGGLAGTGKSTLIAILHNDLKGSIVVAPTGKAVSSLQKKGIAAATIHSTIYNVTPGGHGKNFFRPKPKIDAETIIVDEASMVANKEYLSIMNYGIPVIWVGDHGQLEPMFGSPRIMDTPDIVLETIHRQDADNPILRLALAWRNGKPVPNWKDSKGRCEITSRENFMDLIGDRQVIVGFNRTRVRINKLLREKLGFKGHPKEGEKLICLKNNARFGIFNGQIVVVKSIISRGTELIELILEFEDSRLIIAPCVRQQFDCPDQITEHQDERSLLMDFANVLTAHKIQGSEYPHVIVYEEIARVWNPMKWRYTTTTRAIESIIYCR